MILWFSGTGNSRYVAEKIGYETGDKLFSINDSMKTGVAYGAMYEQAATYKSEGDKQAYKPEGEIKAAGAANLEDLIVVAPTYAWRLPKVVENWLRKSELEGAKHIWFVMTCGGDIGGAAKYNKKIATDKGIEYMGTAAIKLPDNYIIMFDAESDEASKKSFAEAEPKIAAAITKLKEGEAFDEPRAGALKKLMSTAINPGFNLSLKSEGYHIEGECIGCGQCAENCPLNNIKLVDGKPVWGKNCTQCMACISYCPTGAIEYKNKTQGKARYTAEKYIKAR